MYQNEPHLPVKVSDLFRELQNRAYVRFRQRVVIQTLIIDERDFGC